MRPPDPEGGAAPRRSLAGTGPAARRGPASMPASCACTGPSAPCCSCGRRSGPSGSGPKGLLLRPSWPCSYSECGSCGRRDASSRLRRSTPRPPGRADPDRPLALGTVRPGEALVLFAVLMLVALGLVLTLNRQTIGLAAAATVLAVVYPFLKRVTHLPQVWLGVAFGWGIPMGFAAVTGTVPPGGMGAPPRQRALGHRVRHDVRHGGSAGRPPRRLTFDRDPVRKRGPDHGRDVPRSPPSPCLPPSAGGSTSACPGSRASGPRCASVSTSSTSSASGIGRTASGPS